MPIFACQVLHDKPCIVEAGTALEAALQIATQLDFPTHQRFVVHSAMTPELVELHPEFWEMAAEWGIAGFKSDLAFDQVVVYSSKGPLYPDLQPWYHKHKAVIDELERSLNEELGLGRLGPGDSETFEVLSTNPRVVTRVVR